MTGPEHYREAERLLVNPATTAAIAAAQVHATLALIAQQGDLAHALEQIATSVSEFVGAAMGDYPPRVCAS